MPTTRPIPAPWDVAMCSSAGLHGAQVLARDQWLQHLHHLVDARRALADDPDSEISAIAAGKRESTA